jgi:hypothetical protein
MADAQTDNQTFSLVLAKAQARGRQIAGIHVEASCRRSARACPPSTQAVDADFKQADTLKSGLTKSQG